MPRRKRKTVSGTDLHNVLFLYRNKKWLRVDNQELYNFAKWVAESNPKLKEETVHATEKFIKTYLVDYGG